MPTGERAAQLPDCHSQELDASHAWEARQPGVACVQARPARAFCCVRETQELAVAVTVSSPRAANSREASTTERSIALERTAVACRRRGGWLWRIPRCRVLHFPRCAPRVLWFHVTQSSVRALYATCEVCVALRSRCAPLPARGLADSSVLQPSALSRACAAYAWRRRSLRAQRLGTRARPAW